MIENFPDKRTLLRSCQKIVKIKHLYKNEIFKKISIIFFLNLASKIFTILRKAVSKILSSFKKTYGKRGSGN